MTSLNIELPNLSLPLTESLVNWAYRNIWLHGTNKITATTENTCYKWAI